MTTMMEAKIEKKPEMLMIGLQLNNLNVNAFPDEEQKEATIPTLWGFFFERIGEIKNRKDLSASYGVCVPTGGMEFTYMAAVEVTSFDEVPEGMVTYTVPAQQYALFTHKGPASTIPEATKKIYGEWLPQTGYETLIAPELEIYDERYCGPMSEDSVMEIWVPIK